MIHADFKYHAKNKCIDGKHQNGIDERPQHAQERASVATDNLSFDQLQDQRVMSLQTEKNFKEGNVQQTQ